MIVRGTETVNPPGSRRWYFGRVHLTICPPLDLTPYRNRAVNQQTVRAATNQLMRVIQSCSGQEYVDGYARRDAA